LANVPEAIDLAKGVKARRPQCAVFIGGHSVSFIAEHVLAQAGGAVDAVLRGEGEDAAPMLVEALGGCPRRAADGAAGGLSRAGAAGLLEVPGVVTPEGAGPAPVLAHNLDETLPARDIGGRRRKYFIGVLDPAASVEFSRGCPWDCSFCSAWTFYGRSYRKVSPEAAAEDVARAPEPGIFLVDDVAFIHPEDGFEIGRAIERRGVHKQYYLETRSDILVRNEEVFRYWRRLGLNYMFLGIESLTDEGLGALRKRSSADVNLKALEVARKLGIAVAINLIADPDWDEAQFELVRKFAFQVPEIVHLTVQTPYPGTETWVTESRHLTTRDYRLFDVQHAVLPTRLPLERFYQELVKTQSVLARKHLGVAALAQTSRVAAMRLLHGQTNFVKMIWKFQQVYNWKLQMEDHFAPVHYELPEPAPTGGKVERKNLYIHVPLRLSKKAGAGADATVGAPAGH
ncbi:MAG: hopanoid C-3 methylase HpnR, partial [Acidimicrobiales bacterium]